MFEQELLRIIKQAATEAVRAGKPADLAIGTVSSEDPLKIRLSKDREYDGDFLLLSRSVTDHKRTVTVPRREATTEAGGTAILKKEEMEVTVHGALKKGEKVLLVRRSGGQQYVVLDRMVE